MANTATRIAHDGYAQLELNQVAFRRDGRIEAQSALKEYHASTATDGFDAAHPAENGMLLVFNPAKREISKPSAATDKVLLNYTTEHMYDERTPGLKNFALVPKTFLPRLGYLATGDKYTTNCVSYPLGDTYASEDKFWEAVEKVGQPDGTPLYACPSTDGTHYVTASATNAVAQVVKADTMPDGQKAIQFIAL